MEKRCVSCRELLPLGEFHRNARTRDGRKPYCRVCASKYQSRHMSKEWRDAGQIGTPDTGWKEFEEEQRWLFIEGEIRGDRVDSQVWDKLVENGVR